MATTLNITENDIYKEVRSYLLGLFSLPNNNVIRGYSNNVPLPAAPFVVMNILTSTDNSTVVRDYDPDNGLAESGVNTTVSMQIDFYGDAAESMCRTFVNLWRDFYACERLVKCQPLFCDDPRYMPFTDESSNFETRWMTVARLNYNPVVIYEQDFSSQAPFVAIQHP